MLTCEAVSRIEKNAAWEVLVTFPRFIFETDQYDVAVLTDLDAVLRVERREPGVNDKIKAAIAAKGA